MLSAMSAAELGFWERRYRREPMGDEPGYWQAARVAATVANYAGRQRKEGSPAIATEFIDFGRFSQEREEPSTEDLEVKLDAALGMTPKR